jgi:hypothetical protein
LEALLVVLWVVRLVVRLVVLSLAVLLVVLLFEASCFEVPLVLGLMGLFDSNEWSLQRFQLWSKPPPGGSIARGQCRFVSPGTPLLPSNVLKWKSVSLPPEILKRHGRG